MPKKALYSAARAMRDVRRAEQFGIHTGAISLDWQETLAWKWHSQETYAGDQEGAFAARGIAVAKGDARFLSPDTVMVGDESYKPEAIVIATGSVPIVPDLPGAHLGDTSEQALHYTEVPDSLLVVGGGYVAVEFATIYALLGADVSVIIRGDRVLRGFDEEISRLALRSLGTTCGRVLTNASVTELAGEPGDLQVTLSQGDGATETLRTQRVLFATGRVPDLMGLECQVAGVDTDARGRLVLSEARTTNPRVWAVGDAAGGLMLTPVASYEGRAVAAAINAGETPSLDYSAVPSVVFGVPQLAQAGLNEDTAGARGIEVDVHRQSFEYLGAAIIEDEREGFAKLLFDKANGTLVGGTVVGPTASDLIWAISLGIQARATREHVRAALGIHPAFSESLNWAGW